MKQPRRILVLNGSFIVGIQATTSGTPLRRGAAGNSAILQSDQGDKVCVEHIAGNVLWTRSNAPFTTFSGFWLGLIESFIITSVG